LRVQDFVERTGATHIYHFTSVANLPSIRQHGLLSYREMRLRGLVPCAPGGDGWSRATDDSKGLDKYVHLCFLPEHPMECCVRDRVGGTKFLEVSVQVLAAPGVMGCGGLANSGAAVLLPIETLLEQISLGALGEIGRAHV
jgi:hypothetical protein